MSITMVLSLNGSEIGQIDNILFTASMNVRQAMEAAYGLTPGHTYNFSLQYFGSELGYEVVTLDSIANQVGSDPDSYIFWALYVNGQLSPTGIDSTVLNDGDRIDWNYQAYSSEVHAGTRYEQMRNAARTLFSQSPRNYSEVV